MDTSVESTKQNVTSPLPPPCLICGSTRISNYQVANGYQLFECMGCRLIFTDLTDITPDFLARFYSGEYYNEHSGGEDTTFGYSGYIENARIWEKNGDEMIARALKHFKKPPQELKLIDIGCAHGFLVKTAEKRGLQSWGIDFSEDAVRFAKETLNLKGILLGDFKTAPLPLANYDIVVLNGSLEHFTDPLDALKRCFDLLAPGGVLVVTTIHHRCGIFGRAAMKPPEHLYYFHCSNLRRLHERAGFTAKIEIKNYWKHYTLDHYLKLVARIIPFPFGWLSKLKFFKKIVMKVPTNEVIVLAHKP